MNSRFSRLAQSYFAYFAILGIVAHYFGLYLSELGLSPVVIGGVLGGMTLGRIVGPFIWAHIADKKRNKRLIIQMGSVIATLCFSILLFKPNIIVLVISLTAFTLFLAAVLPQLESLTAQNFKGNSHLYSKARLWGSISFTCLVVLSGWAFTSLGVVATVEYVTLALLVLLAIAAFRLPADRKLFASKQMDSQIMVQVKRPEMIWFLLSCLCLQISFATYYGFFSIYLTGAGYSGLYIGILVAVGVTSEIALFIKGGHWVRRFNITNILIICYLLTAVRWLCIGEFVDSFIVLLLVQTIHALSYALHHLAAQKFIRQHFHSTQQSRGQAIYIGLTYGGGGALGSVLAGAIWEWSPLTAFYIAVLFCILATLMALRLRQVS